MIGYLSLGSNIGDRKASLCRALQAIEGNGNQLLACSAVYQTQPLEIPNQPDFLNLVAKIETFWPPQKLLECCQQVEREMGRVRNMRYGPRIIDIDILLLDNLQIELPQLTVPHPRMHQRKFVLIPLCEIAPKRVHPTLGLSIRQLLAALLVPIIHLPIV
jgi:2-amino-4-hydroxy-6-hydroxymethyldihydropteridine diphosphokinase